MLYNAIICRYHEIALKASNRSNFERCLAENIKMLLDPLPVKVHRVRGRMWIDKPDRACFTDAELAVAEQRLAHAFGLESYSPARLVAPDMDAIRSALAELAPQVVEPALAALPEGGRLTFRIRARRSDKQFPLRSQEIEIELATWLGNYYGHERMKIDLVNAELTFGVEVRDELAVVFLETRRGPGGLPVGSNARVLALLSGGIDSPVACYLAMKRGSGVDYITFHSSPYTPPETTEKVTRIAGYLNRFQRPGRLALCNLAPIQKLIRDKCNPRLRTVLYRRMMFRLATMLAGKFRCEALLTGESLGQVASQTVRNMATIDRATEMLVLRPLAGQDKMETVAWAERIGTFEMSKEQVPDSCTVFAPDHPSTGVELERAEEEERKLGEWQSVLDEIFGAIEYLTP